MKKNYHQSNGYDFGNQVSIDELFEIIDEHIHRTDNPHRITNKDIIGIENIDNTSDKDKIMSDPTKKYVDSEFTANLEVNQDSDGNTIIKLISKDGKIISSLNYSFLSTTDIKGNEFIDSYVATIKIVTNPDDHEQYLEAYSPSGKKLLAQKIPENKIKDISIMEKDDNIYLVLKYSDDSEVKGSLMPLIDILTDRLKYTATSESKVVLGDIKCGELIENVSIKDLLDRLFTLNNYVTTGKYIKGSYFIVKDVAERDQITNSEDSIVVNGSVVYVVDDDQEYIWKHDEWIPTNSGMEEIVSKLLADKIKSLESKIVSEMTKDIDDMHFKVNTLNTTVSMVRDSLNDKIAELENRVAELESRLNQ